MRDFGLDLCIDCYNKQRNKHLTEDDFELELDFCESCGKEKLLIIYRKPSLLVRILIYPYQVLRMWYHSLYSYFHYRHYKKR